MWIKKEELERLIEKVEYYKNMAGTFQVDINQKNAEIENLKEQIKRLEASNLQNDTSNQHE